MCGRYIVFSSEEYREMKAILKEISRHYKTGVGVFEPGEIFPSTAVPSVYRKGGETEYGLFKWGFELPGAKRLVINARSETLDEKRMFRGLVAGNRCLLPANGFFEWDRKVKYLIKPKELGTFYMAGIYNNSGDVVIITSPASAGMAHIHDRMPVIFDKSTGGMWLDDFKKEMLKPYEGPLSIEKAG